MLGPPNRSNPRKIPQEAAPVARLTQPLVVGLLPSMKLPNKGPCHPPYTQSNLLVIHLERTAVGRCTFHPLLRTLQSQILTAGKFDHRKAVDPFLRSALESIFWLVWDRFFLHPENSCRASCNPV